MIIDTNDALRYIKCLTRANLSINTKQLQKFLPINQSSNLEYLLSDSVWSTEYSNITESAKMSLEILQQVKKHCVNIPRNLYFALINVCGKSGNWELTIDLVKEMTWKHASPSLEESYGVEDIIEQCPTDRYNQNYQSATDVWNCFPGLPRANIISPAIQKFQLWCDKMYTQRLFPESECFTRIIRACAHGGHWQEALSLIHMMRYYNVTLSSKSLTELLHACMTGRQYKLLDTVWEIMTKNCVLSDGVTNPLKNSSCDDTSERQTSNHGKIESVYPTLQAILIYMEHCGKTRKLSEALRIGHWLIDVIDGVNNLSLVDNATQLVKINKVKSSNQTNWSDFEASLLMDMQDLEMAKTSVLCKMIQVSSLSRDFGAIMTIISSILEQQEHLSESITLCLIMSMNQLRYSQEAVQIALAAFGILSDIPLGYSNRKIREHIRVYETQHPFAKIEMQWPSLNYPIRIATSPTWGVAHRGIISCLSLKHGMRLCDTESRCWTDFESPGQIALHLFNLARKSSNNISVAQTNTISCLIKVLSVHKCHEDLIMLWKQLYSNEDIENNSFLASHIEILPKSSLSRVLNAYIVASPQDFEHVWRKLSPFFCFDSIKNMCDPQFHLLWKDIVWIFTANDIMTAAWALIAWRTAVHLSCGDTSSELLKIMRDSSENIPLCPTACLWDETIVLQPDQNILCKYVSGATTFYGKLSAQNKKINKGFYPHGWRCKIPRAGEKRGVLPYHVSSLYRSIRLGLKKQNPPNIERVYEALNRIQVLDLCS